MHEMLYVVKNATNVKINEDGIKCLVDMLDINSFSHWSKSIDTFNNLDEREKILFVFLLESINFCFWPNYEWKAEYKGKEYSGSDALLYTLIKALDNKILNLKMENLIKVTSDDFKIIFLSKNELPIMMNERYLLFMETVKKINSKGLDNFINELYSIKKIKDLELYITCNFKYFDDKCMYKNKIIHFNKRCRLLISDLFYTNVFIKKNIKDFSEMLGCADYRIPELLYNNGILIYSTNIETKIKTGELILYGTEEEIEIRASTLYVLEVIKNGLKAKGIIVSTAEVDNIVWNMSRKNKTNFVHHTKSIFY